METGGGTPVSPKPNLNNMSHTNNKETTRKKKRFERHTQLSGSMHEFSNAICGIVSNAPVADFALLDELSHGSDRLLKGHCWSLLLRVIDAAAKVGRIAVSPVELRC
jgi:hypothetical protein